MALHNPKEHNSQLPLVSVCITTYNHEAYIEQTLQGVFNQQTKYPLEIIIYNDCSTDNSHVIIERLTGDRNNVLYHVQETNKGISQNFYESLLAANGKYVAVLDGDDYWTDPQKIEKQIDFLEANPKYAGCFTDTFMIYGTESEKGKSGALKPKHKRSISINNIADDGFWIPTSTFVYRNSKLIKPLPEQCWSITMVDIFLFYLIIAEGSVTYLDWVSALYRKHDKGEWSGLNAKKQSKFTQHNLGLMYQYFKNLPQMEAYINTRIANQKRADQQQFGLGAKVKRYMKLMLGKMSK